MIILIQSFYRTAIVFMFLFQIFFSVKFHWIHFNLIDIGFWGKKRPDEAKFIGSFGYFGEVIVYFLWSAIQFLAFTKAWIHGVTSSAWRACG